MLQAKQVLPTEKKKFGTIDVYTYSHAKLVTYHNIFCCINRIFINFSSQGENLRVLVDPLGPSEGPLVTSALSRRALSPSQIDVVVATHGHTDHLGNLSLFDGLTIVGQCVSRRGLFATSPLAEGRSLRYVDLEIEQVGADLNHTDFRGYAVPCVGVEKI